MKCMKAVAEAVLVSFTYAQHFIPKQDRLLHQKAKKPVRLPICETQSDE